jgi:hypothetical protein
MMFKTTPVGQNFVAVRIVPSEAEKRYFSTLSLFDEQMNVITDLYSQEFPESEREIPMVTDSIHFSVYKNNVYIEQSPHGFCIAVYDSTGNRIKTLRKNIPAEKFTERDRTNVLENFRQDGMIRMMINSSGGWENFKQKYRLIFPSQFPPIQDLLVRDDKIYVLTFASRGDLERWVVMDSQGEVVRTTDLPIPCKSSFTARSLGKDNRLYGIIDNTFYYLKENEGNEEWEVHRVKID